MSAVRVTSRSRRVLSRRRLDLTGLDLVGLALVAAAVAWSFGAAWASGGSPGPVVALILASAAALWAGRIVASLNRSVVPALVAVAAAIVWLTSPFGVLSRGPLAGPFHYANAKGAFFMLGSVAGLMVYADSSGPWGRRAGVAAAVAFGAVPMVTGVVAASVLVLASWAAAIVLTRGTHIARSVIRLAGALFGAALLVTVLLAATYPSRGAAGALGRVADAPLSQHRVALWHDAWRLLVRAPDTGVGPGRFQEFSPIARADPADDRWAHNEFLQQGAEQGVVGLLLVVALFGWGLVRLQARSRTDALTALAAVALAGLATHATVDYVLHFPALPIAAATLAGAGIPQATSRVLSEGRTS